MNVFYGLEKLPTFKNAIVTIGTFDGVHAGHKVIISRLIEKAAEVNGEAVIITFEPHPRFVLASDAPTISLLNTLEEKIQNLKQQGVHHLVVVNFTPEFAAMNAADYVEKFLVEKFHPHTIIIGFDHLFGSGRKGNFQLLEQLKTTYDFELEEIPMQIIEQNKISSTQIRHALIEGDVAKAALFLGKNYSLQGIVTEGRKMGRTLGYPTANIDVEDKHKLIPAKGVYAVYIETASEQYRGMMNIGTNPTVVNSLKITIEVHIFDFDLDIYGKMIRISFVDRLRDELKFENIQDLIDALHQDKQQALSIFAERENVDHE